MGNPYHDKKGRFCSSRKDAATKDYASQGRPTKTGWKKLARRKKK